MEGGIRVEEHPNTRRPLARDTAPVAEARQIAFFRQREVSERIALACELTAFTVALSRTAVARAHPHADALEQARVLAALCFGQAYAAHIRQAPTITGSEAFAAATIPVIHVFEQLGIAYYVGGSVASTAYSVPRSIRNIDIAVALEPAHLGPLIQSLEGAYAIEHSAVLGAVTYQEPEAAFTILHHETGISIDIFVTADTAFDRSRYARGCAYPFPGTSTSIRLASPEDIVLNKLRHIHLRSANSETHWRDVQSILRVQAGTLDLGYLYTWAATWQFTAHLDAMLQR